MDWSPQQDEALSRVSAWLKSGSPQVFRLFGYAGTGKTTLARHFAEGMDGEVAFGAFTGKAAHVLRTKGCTDATTIHSLIYRPKSLEEEDPSFVINRDSAASKADLIVIDECSMVDEELGRDLLSFGVPVLVLGDPAQLPPVKGGGFFTEHEPDMMLTEVHRQARDNPIIRLSMAVREGESLPRGAHGDSLVIRRADIDAEAVLKADQVLVGMNRTRRLYNRRIRELLGFRDPMPAVGEKLVCLRNDKQKGLLNGGTWTVKRLREPLKGFVRMEVTPEEEPSRKAVRVKVLREFFEGGDETIPFLIRRESDEFDYGYALTVHKAQGSQWDDVVLFDESGAFREHRARWLYTGLTRAARRITVVV
ncbi:ATP-dependent RecD-like DNA helicase [Alsobacter sp. SYSU M60028]|uniref:ATP-dependent RecD-like DNA helicase n=1 Tax=Alsobacter ponti TaxID=2962936 RepID=A0ABT1L8D0_9HYPH|nr:ATP-dependent RecD-like DNA helicase [Alsobacter ponti]MCP8936980.1 ATP-dependent RecD-like DNA helicase [Alsobacter ponti]